MTFWGYVHEQDNIGAGSVSRMYACPRHVKKSQTSHRCCFQTFDVEPQFANVVTNHTNLSLQCMQRVSKHVYISIAQDQCGRFSDKYTSALLKSGRRSICHLGLNTLLQCILVFHCCCCRCTNSNRKFFRDLLDTYTMKSSSFCMVDRSPYHMARSYGLLLGHTNRFAR